jgi:protease-4
MVVLPFILLLTFGLALSLFFPSDATNVTGVFDSVSLTSPREKVLRQGQDGDSGSLAIVSLRGEIAGQGSGLSGDSLLAQVAAELQAAGRDPLVKAVVLQIDSPGGGLTPSDLLHQEIVRLRRQDKVVVAWAGSLMASGGYYVAAGADAIVSSPTAIIGSIGVVISRFQVEGLLDKLGVKAEPVLAGRLKDLGSPFRDLSPEERTILQDTVDSARQRFVEVVAEGRHLTLPATEDLADGRIFTPEQAKNLGLVDQIGYVDDAIDLAEALVGEKGLRVFTYRRPFALASLLYGTDLDSFLPWLRESLSSAPRLAARWPEE